MKTYLVGGAVRDQLLNYPVYDKDWVVVGSTPEEMLSLGYQPVGHDFPVFIHPDTHEEYALARTERKSGKGYGGFQYHANKNITLEEDLIRRDLTINAMAMDEHGTLYDPYHGQQDLDAKLLRHVSPAFSEDPLRVLRVARFAARYHHLGFKVADETLQLMAGLATTDELEHLTAERVWQEFARALAEQSPWVFLQVLQQTKATTKVIPEFANYLAGSTPETDLQNICKHSQDSDVRFACLCTLAGLSDSEIASLCDRLRVPKATKMLSMQCQRHHTALSHFDHIPAAEKLTILQALDLFRRPQRLTKLTACIDALHPVATYDSLTLILAEIAQLQPQDLIQEGFKGAALGEELNKRKLAICARHGTGKDKGKTNE
ncbi:MAG: hypothetical protein CSA60_02625 [Neptuniibacter caesariensis]|uniref:CCA-adding enzyme n=1 Tax=Neptuniibacter caesariensis TaxID=207954 RepID=A0A2G6JN70_NEPCE|nr:MAG: hypothetical protein CSA60_02625 [Neptuniibacter caesariensis]